MAFPVKAADLSECISLIDDGQRLACYDALFLKDVERDELPVKPPVVETRIAEKPVADTSPEERFGLVEPVRKEVNAIESTVVEVSETAYGKLILSLANGQVWQQLDSKRMRLKAGETIVIRAASMGSHQLQKLSGSGRMRVRRTL